MDLRTFFVVTFVTGLGMAACQAKYSDADFGAPRAVGTVGGSGGLGGSSGSGGGSGDCSDSECSDEMAARGLLGVCVEGSCEAMGCVAGREDCDSAVDGCETSIDTDRTACGDCDTHCGAEDACIEAACTPYALAYHVLAHTEGLSTDPLLAAAAGGGVFVGYRFDQDLHLEEQGHVFEVEAASRDAGLIRLDAEGNMDFALSFNSGGTVDLRSVSSSQQGVVAAGDFRAGGGAPLELESVDSGFHPLNPLDPFEERDQGFVHALDQLGNHRFTVSVHGQGDVRIYASTADDAGNVYLLGSFSSSFQVGASQVDVGDLEWGGFIVKLLANGALAWDLVFEADEFENFLHLGSLAVDAAGRLYYAVASSGSITVGGTTSAPAVMVPRLLVLEPDGSLAFLRTYSSVVASLDSAHPIVGPDNRVFLVMNVDNTQSAIGEHPLEQGPHLRRW